VDDTLHISLAEAHENGPSLTSLTPKIVLRIRTILDIAPERYAETIALPSERVSSSRPPLLALAGRQQGPASAMDEQRQPAAPADGRLHP
jgi:hypothetical protein